jgi:hypothetical protein
VTQIVTLNSSVFLGILNSDYDLVIIDVHTGTELYFIVHKTVSYELKMYHDNYLCMNRVCYARYTVISALCIFRLCCNLKTNLFIPIVLSNILCWIQKKSVFDQYVVTKIAHTE